MGEDPKSTEPTGSDETPSRPRVLGDTSLRFEPPPQEASAEGPPPVAKPRPAMTPSGAPPAAVEPPRPVAPQPRVARPSSAPVTPFAPPPPATPAKAGTARSTPATASPATPRK